MFCHKGLFGEKTRQPRGNKSKAANPQRTALKVIGETAALETKIRPAIALPAHRAVAINKFKMVAKFSWCIQKGWRD